MDLDTLVEAVKHRAGMESNGEALTAIRATVETLAECVSEQEAARLAARLPLELRPILLDAGITRPRHFPATEFLSRASHRQRRELRTGMTHAVAVMSALHDILSLADLRAGLPSDYNRLFVPAAA
jgi:uncharacterized protein (DUF2267 family)